MFGSIAGRLAQAGLCLVVLLISSYMIIPIVQIHSHIHMIFYVQNMTMYTTLYNACNIH